MQPNHFGFHGFFKKCLLVAIVTTSMSGFTAESKASTDEEAFLIRRIAEFWKDGDYSIVKEQIQDFIKRYPSSTMKDYLQGILADLSLQQNKYVDALNLYSTISERSVYEKIILNKLQCYYEVGQFENLIKEGEPYLKSTAADFLERKNEYQFIMAEGYFRHAQTLSDEKSKKEFLSKALPLYEQLLNSEYDEISSFALAEIFRQTNQKSKAIDLYLTLVDKYPSKKESILFNAGLLETHINKSAAIEIFDRVVALNGTKAGEAAFNRLVLYFQTDQFENVVNQHKIVYSHVPDSEMPTYHYIVGKSYYQIKDFESAILPLEKFILEQKNSSEQLRDALVLQLTSSQKTNNEVLYEKTLTKFKTFYPEDIELGKAYFLHAMMLKREGNYTKALSQLKILKDQKVNFSDRETLLYEYAVCSHENKKFTESYDSLKTFIADFPASEKINSAYRYFLSSCLNLSKYYEADKSNYTKQSFIGDLKKVLDQKVALNPDEHKEYNLLYAKISYELGQYSESLQTISEYIKEYPQDATLSDAYLLTALSLGKLNADPEKFCSYLEKAIELSPETYNISSLQLQLYNAYVQRAKLSEGNPQNVEKMYEKAATSLYSALKDPSQSVKIENQLWLASYYYDFAKNYLGKHWMNSIGDDKNIALTADRSLEIYNKILSNGKGGLKQIEGSQLHFEAEALKFAELTGYRGNNEKKVSILKSLIDQQSKHKEWAWQFKRQAIFELAQTQEKLQNLEAAYEAYSMINEYPATSTPITTACALKSAKIKFDLIDKKNKTEKNPQVIAVLNQLKDLQIRKNALSEPMHLEAGIEYIKVRTALTQDSLKESRHLFFLVRMKEDFTSNEEGVGSIYLSTLKSHPEKEILYKSYMKFIDAEIFRLQSKQLLSGGKKEEGAALKDKALSLLTEIEQTIAPTEYLHSEVTKSLKVLR